VSRADFRRGDRLLLCSDGLTGLVDDDRLLAILQQCPEPGGACDAMVALRLAKTAADEEGVSLSAFITRAVRERLEERRRAEAARQVLATFSPDEFPTPGELGEPPQMHLAQRELRS
jgi:serine/threonine protein phosphatase PrpC